MHDGCRQLFISEAQNHKSTTHVILIFILTPAPLPQPKHFLFKGGYVTISHVAAQFVRSKTNDNDQAKETQGKTRAAIYFFGMCRGSKEEQRPQSEANRELKMPSHTPWHYTIMTISDYITINNKMDVTLLRKCLGAWGVRLVGETGKALEKTIKV